MDDFTLIVKGRPKRVATRFVRSVADFAETLENDLEFNISDLKTSYAATLKYTQMTIQAGMTRFGVTREGKPLGVDMGYNSCTSRVYQKRKRQALKRRGRIAALRKANVPCTLR